MNTTPSSSSSSSSSSTSSARARWSRLALFVLPSLSLACGQEPPPGSEFGDTDEGVGVLDGEDSLDGGEAETDDTEGDEGPSDPDGSLYPLVDGASWVYIASNDKGQVLGMEVVDATEVEWDGEPAWVLTDNPNDKGEWTKSVIARDGDITARVHKEIMTQGGPIEIVDYDPGFVRADDGWETPGHMEEFLYERTETDGAGLNPQVEPRGHRYTVLAVDETVTVGAGTFSCVKVERVRTVGTKAGERVLSWYAPGIGKVREERPAEGRTEELASVSIPNGESYP
ncbi:hypothetical protein ENSA5_12940 [Enhygromyxa salina]|uniref:DUF3108 domain-containing protein n=1 Tax=Enhygromyxa salina TaxID=215803 RepID=A0A2S9YF60_9BACT|nr:hypothetical protein [Enhygromyxa salina]PRQ03744.1 hypothetical protein ENSA5_12940 [Enhygromyxa salina]